MRSPHRLLARLLPPDVAEFVIGDLVERDVRGFELWRESVHAWWTMSDTHSSGEDIVQSFIGDLRHAARLLRRAPGFTAVSVLTLALGIGATTAIFAVVDPVLIESLPYPHPEQIAIIADRGRDGSDDNIGFLTIRDIREQSKSIESAAAVGSWLPIVETPAGPERTEGDRVSWTYFRTLGVRPALGRDFLPEEDAPGKNGVVILSNGYWKRAFGSDSAIIGKTIQVFGGPMTVAGVMPAGFQNVLSPNAQIWRVLGYATQPYTCRTCHHLRMVARLKPGVTQAEAQREINSVHQRIAAAYPAEYQMPDANIVGLKGSVDAPYRASLLALAGSVALMLLIAIANVAAMLLARSVRREEEFAVRTALGAGRSRLRRQLLTEGMLLVTIGGAAGLVFAYAAIPALVANLPASLPRLAEIHLDARTVGVAAILTALMALVVGLTPMIGSRVSDLGIALRGGRRTAGGSRQVIRSGLVVGEVALALMLLVACGLMARTMQRLLETSPGFDAGPLLTLEINSVGPRYSTNDAIYQYHDLVRAAVSAVPGVQNVATTSMVPLGGNFDRYGIHAVDRPETAGENAPSADRYSVSPDYLRTMGIDVVQGRDFLASEMTDTTNRVIIISEAMARKLWGSENPLGKFIRTGANTGPTRRVIGVTRDVRHTGLDANLTMNTYVPERQWQGADDQVDLVVRAQGDPLAIASAARKAVRSVDPTQPIVRVATMDQLVESSLAQRRLAFVLFAVFAGTALLLAVAGIYGVLAGRVAERTREIGLRSALGASPGQIARLVILQGARLAAIGLVIGLGGALGLSRFLQSMLFGVDPQDPLTLVAVAGLLGGVTLIACGIPARRALAIDPTEALRAD
jgi:putative ABC transport system permease protein